MNKEKSLRIKGRKGVITSYGYIGEEVEMTLTLNEIKSLAEYVGFVINMDETKKFISHWEELKDDKREGITIIQKEGGVKFFFEDENGNFYASCNTCVRVGDDTTSEVIDVEPLAPIKLINSGVSNA